MAAPEELSRQRKHLLKSLTDFLEGPMIFLGFIWLLMLILEFTGYSSRELTLLGTVIWIVFIADFLLKFILAPNKLVFLKKNVLTAVSLLIPALRMFRIFRLLRFVRFLRGSRLIKVVASLNRGMRSLNATMKRRGFGYVMTLTLVVILAGAAGMFAFESQQGTLNSYAESLWWTIMLVITVGSDYWPRTAEGGILCVLLAVYGFAVFGYITATLASFFVGRDAEDTKISQSGSVEVEELKGEIRELRKLLIEKQGKRNSL